MSKTTKSKLSLKRTTVRTLTDEDLGGVAGGLTVAHWHKAGGGPATTALNCTDNCGASVVTTALGCTDNCGGGGGGTGPRTTAPGCSNFCTA